MSEIIMDVDDWLDSFDHDYHIVELDEKKIRLRPMTVTEIFVACKRKPAFRKFIQDSITFFIDGIQGDSNASQKLFDRFNGESITEYLLDAGLDVAVMMIACCMDRPHDEALEQKLLKKPDDVNLMLFAKSQAITLGGQDVVSFFMAKLNLLKEMGVMDLGKKPKRPEPKGPTRSGQSSKRAA